MSWVKIFSLVILLPCVLSTSILSPKDYLNISLNQTLVSPGDNFELGFFKLAGGSEDNDRWYFGMWFKTTRDYVWVANRDNPILDSNGTLKLSGNKLVLFNGLGTLVWSSSQATIPFGSSTKSPVVAELLSNGNFVIRFSAITDPAYYIWESFNHPTDTLLPGMKLGWDKKSNINRNITSWKNMNNPASRDYTYKIIIRGFSQRFLLKKRYEVVHRSDAGNRVGTNGLRATEQTKGMIFNFTRTNEEVTYSFTVTDNKVLVKLNIDYEGMLRRLSWPLTVTAQKWIMLWEAPADQCDRYATCGNHSYCDMARSPLCHCIEGFTPKNGYEWSLGDTKRGCERKIQLACDHDQNDFLPLKKVKLPDTSAAVFFKSSLGLLECRRKCARDCKCTAFAEIDTENGGSDCILWKTDLVDIRVFTSQGHDLFVKLADIDLREKRSISSVIISIIVIGGILVSITLGLVFWWWRCCKVAGDVSDGTMPNSSTPNGSNISYDDIIVATNNFCDGNQLGRGGYGKVYKGILSNGEEVAVKRLTTLSGEGIQQFANEARSIKGVQHINLVRLLGYCQHHDEHILVYEFLENLSLDLHLFGDTGRSKLNWRTRLDIVHGVSRGLSYLHEDSRYRVIHRDLKGGNILLDIDMTPKIADFGMAKLVGRNEAEINRGPVVGTCGYISPEYRIDRVFSNKSDVYSFGIVLLEVLTGTRNSNFRNSKGDTSLPISVWSNWEQGTLLDIVDPYLEPSNMVPSQIEEVIRCFHIGLLCVQDRPEDRPRMSSVVVMLESDSSIPQPKKPCYSVFEIGSSSSTQHPPNEYWTANQFTRSAIKPR